MRTWLIAITCVSALMAGGLALAQETKAPAATSQAPRPCRDDVKKFCPDVKAGDGRVGQCLKEHKDELSQTCRDTFKGKAAAKGNSSN